jgi:FkbM family methyltransferase
MPQVVAISARREASCSAFSGVRDVGNDILLVHRFTDPGTSGINPAGVAVQGSSRGRQGARVECRVWANGRLAFSAFQINMSSESIASRNAGLCDGMIVEPLRELYRRSIERLRRQDAALSRSATVQGITLQNDHVVGLYDFASTVIGHGEVSHLHDDLIVITDAQQWSYTVLIPIGPAFRNGETDLYQVELAVHVEYGAVQIGILNREEKDFVGAALVPQNCAWQTVTLFTPPIDRAGPLVIRNAADTGASRARCRLVSVTRKVGTISEKFVPAAPSLEEAIAVATQIQASAEVLAAMTSSNPEIASAVAPVVVDATGRLRHALARGGKGLIGTHAGAIEAIFESLTSNQLCRIASTIAATPTLHPIPGWRMDSFLESAELATFVRYAIWLVLRRHADAEPVNTPWHAGTRLGLNLGNDLSLAVFVGGSFEPNEFALLDQVLQPGMTVLDGGANEGAYTLFLAARVGREGRVLAVEPSPRELERLKANVALNGMPQVTVIEAALAEQPGEVELLLAEPHHAGQNTLGGFAYPGMVAAGSLRVAATTVDALAKAQNLASLDMIKLDIEGAELRALIGAGEVLRRWRPLLLFEAAQGTLARQGGSLQGVLSLLADCDYRVLSFDRATGAPAPIGRASPSDNLVAVHRERDWGLPAS